MGAHSEGDLNEKLQTLRLGTCWIICACFKHHILVGRVEAIQIIQPPPPLCPPVKQRRQVGYRVFSANCCMNGLAYAIFLF